MSGLPSCQKALEREGQVFTEDEPSPQEAEKFEGDSLAPESNEGLQRGAAARPPQRSTLDTSM